MWYRTYDEYLEKYIGEIWDDEEEEVSQEERDKIVTDRMIEEIGTRHLSPLQKFFWKYRSGKLY